MNNYEYSPIADNFLKECHKINQDNVPEVGSRSLEGLTNSIENSDYLYIDRIAIDSKFRNNKLASGLYSKIIDFSKNNSIENLTAEINLLPSINTPSFNFHKNFGFIEIDSVKYAEDYEVSLQKKIID